MAIDIVRANEQGTLLGNKSLRYSEHVLSLIKTCKGETHCNYYHLSLEITKPQISIKLIIDI